MEGCYGNDFLITSAHFFVAIQGGLLAEVKAARKLIRRNKAVENWRFWRH